MRRSKARRFLLPTELPAIKFLTRAEGWARCAACKGQPRKDRGVPLAVWIGRPSLQAPAVCVCHVCLTSALVGLGFLSVDDLAIAAPAAGRN